VFSPHTSLDSVWGGINDWLAEGILGRQARENEVSPLAGQKVAPDGKIEGAEGRIVTLDAPLDIKSLEERIRRFLGLSHCRSLAGALMSFTHVNVVQVGYGTIKGDVPSTPIRTVAICAGSGGSMLAGTDADVYFTGEMSHVSLCNR
jgi:putative NIF3 family GTP cyclohydrolase 1 type 2